MRFIIIILWAPVLIYLSFAVFYHLFLALMFFWKKEPKQKAKIRKYHYQVLVPAHNEERLIGRLMESFQRLDYDIDKFKVTVIADNCTDRTASIVSDHHFDVQVRHDSVKKGKGHAIEWALEHVNVDDFDAVVIIDADNVVDPFFFQGVNEIIAGGAAVVQCNNNIANPDENAFTRIMHLSRTIDNELYHHAKYKIGLSSFLMVNGMCFTKGILEKYGWSVSSYAEDYEYYAKLINQNEMIGFAVNAKLYHQESVGIRHATDQRLRWSSGRFQVARKYGFGLIRKGLKEKNYKIVDASFPLVLPNLSLMVNMTASVMAASLLLNCFYPVSGVVYWLLFLLVLEIVYFISGMYLTKIPVWKLFFAFCYAPVFLCWKGYIDIKGIIGKKTKGWGKADRL